MALCCKTRFTYIFARHLHAFVSMRLVSDSHLQAANRLDALDTFTTHLIQKKCQKWGELFDRVKSARVTEPVLLDKRKTCIDDMSDTDLNVIIRKALDNEDLELLGEVVTSERLPNHAVFLELLWLYSQKGKVNEIVMLLEVYAKIYPEYAEKNAQFQDFLAGAIWAMGDIVKSIKMYETIYRNNHLLRSRIRNSLKYFIPLAVDNQSEAALVTMMKFSENLWRDFHDIFPMLYLWQACFLSGYYTDQCLALQLLEDQPGLVQCLSNKITRVAVLALVKHRKEAVYRLLETFLKLEAREHYCTILVALFDYELRQRNKRGCFEIINWSVSHNVTFLPVQYGDLINLLLSSTEGHTVCKKVLKDTATPLKYEF